MLLSSPLRGFGEKELSYPAHSHVFDQQVFRWCQAGCLWELREFLSWIDAKRFDINATCNPAEHVNPIHCAAYHGHAECVRLLLAHDAAVDKEMPGGHTALYLAAQNGYLEVCKVRSSKLRRTRASYPIMCVWVCVRSHK